MSEQPLCLNCGAPVAGNFCGECGQRVDESGVSMHDWLGKTFAAATDVDNKVLRTLRLCITAPGKLAWAIHEAGEEKEVNGSKTRRKPRSPCRPI